MRYVMLLSMLLPGAAMAATDPAARISPSAAKARSKPQCVDRPELRQADARRPSVGMHKLGDLPPAHAIYTVVRQIDGCPVPVSVPAR